MWWWWNHPHSSEFKMKRQSFTVLDLPTSQRQLLLPVFLYHILGISKHVVFFLLQYTKINFFFFLSSYSSFTCLIFWYVNVSHKQNFPFKDIKYIFFFASIINKNVIQVLVSSCLFPFVGMSEGRMSRRWGYTSHFGGCCHRTVQNGVKFYTNHPNLRVFVCTSPLPPPHPVKHSVRKYSLIEHSGN